MIRFSILTPVHNPPIWALENCVQSVITQTFEDWELIIVDDGSTNPEVKILLDRLSKTDHRIKVYANRHNQGIVQASQKAFQHASGEFAVLLDHDDELNQCALEVVDHAISANESVDYLYSDEDKVSQNGDHFDVFRKPDWSPERLRAQNYCCHLSVIRMSIMKEVGGFRDGFDGSQDYDLILRVTEIARQIIHIPHVLYHWHVVPGSTAQGVDNKPYAFEAAKRALTDHLKRIGIAGQVADAGYGYHRIIRELNTYSKVSIIIPTCGSSKIVFGKHSVLVLNALDSILEYSTYSNYEIVVVADTHTPEIVLYELFHKYDSRVTTILYDKPFNFSDKCNLGVVNSSGDFVLLLNDDVQIISPDWIETLLGHAQEADVGMVGPLLLLEDGRIQSASHSNMPTPHNFRNGHSSMQPGEFGVLAIARECSGVTGAAVLLRREVYNQVGGLSRQFPNCFNDVDLCFKILQEGFRIIWTPHARLFHFESVSRDPAVDQRELDLLMNRWGRYFGQDRYCNLV